jgi:hypothetical protein
VFILIINRVGGVVTNRGGNDGGDVEDDGHDLVEVEEQEYSCAEVCQEPEGVQMGTVFIAGANLYKLTQ